jgi:hypothetical protein
VPISLVEIGMKKSITLDLPVFTEDKNPSFKSNVVVLTFVIS